MAFWAVGFSRIPRLKSVSPHQVFVLRYGLKMIRVHTRRIAAFFLYVIQYKTIRNIPFKNRIGNAMGCEFLIAYRETPISKFLLLPIPNPALAYKTNHCHEPFLYRVVCTLSSSDDPRAFHFYERPPLSVEFETFRQGERIP